MEIELREWASRVGVPVGRARRWAREGRIMARYLWGRWLVPESEPLPVVAKGRPRRATSCQ